MKRGAWTQAGAWLRGAEQRFGEIGVDVQTTRLALPALSSVLESHDNVDLVAYARHADNVCESEGIGYVSLGPLAPGRTQNTYAGAIHEAIANTERVFATLATTTSNGASDTACLLASNVIHTLASTTERGFGNLRFGAIALCPPGIPFFPAAYHDGPQPTIALALEGADIAVNAFEQAVATPNPEHTLTTLLESAVLPIEHVALTLESDLGVRYLGADLSLAPYPETSRSIAHALELLTGVPFGSAGTLSAAALVTRAVRSARVRQCGFRGLMLPVLEDNVLARRAGEQRFTLNDLLIFSCVCGTGLDTVPLPGDTPVHTLAAIIRDVTALSVTLRKPLTARLFPIPGKGAGEPVVFEFPYFAPGSVMRLSAES
jgi:uncharacterized protein (UPF0210 family)